MSQGFCGNDCTTCTGKLQQSCPGCRLGPGQKYGSECDIAKCAIAKNFSSCDNCGRSDYCSMRKNRVCAAQNRSARQQREQQTLQEHLRISGVLSEGLMALLVMICVSILVNVACGVGDLVFQVTYFSGIASVVLCVVQGLLFLKIGSASVNFRVAGVLSLVSAPFALVITFIDHPVLAPVLSVCQILLLVGTEFVEFLGYIVVTEEFKSDLSRKWNNLCVAHFVLLAVFGIALVIALLGLYFVFVFVLAACVGYLATIVLKYIRLYQTVRFFQNYH